MKKFGVILGLLVVAFLAGFLPPYTKQRDAEVQLRDAQHEIRRAELRDYACLAFLQASHKDYGLAAATTTRFFDLCRELANQTADPPTKSRLLAIVGLRDKINSELATADPVAASDLQQVLIQTRDVTLGASGAFSDR